MSLSEAELARINLLEDLTRHPGWSVLAGEAERVVQADLSALTKPNRTGVSDDYIRGHLNAFLWLTKGIHADIVSARKQDTEAPPDSLPAGDPYQET